ncbi:MAG: PDZ domain-containing protein [Pseudomonadota bacterium]
MSKKAGTILAVSVVVALIVGAALAQRFSVQAPERAAASMAFDQTAPVEVRIAALEASLAIERQARQLLQEEVMVLTDELERLQAPGVGQASPVQTDRVAAGAVEDAEPVERRGRFERRAERLRQRLVSAGFTEADANWILRRESELQMEALNDRYAARRAGENASATFGGRSTQAALRQELGEARYEQYLEASGRPTRIAISSVFEGSPALAAGLRPGDEIVNYDGRRVFAMSEVTSLTLEGAVGEPVPVDILRDGALMQVSIPRGPLGVTGGRRYRR